MSLWWVCSGQPPKGNPMAITQAELMQLRNPNVHPVDELQSVREEIKILQDRADELREQLLQEGADLHGDQYTATITPGVRETLDRKAITEAFGEKAIAPFIKATPFSTVKFVENRPHAKA